MKCVQNYEMFWRALRRRRLKPRVPVTGSGERWFGI